MKRKIDGIIDSLKTLQDDVLNDNAQSTKLDKANALESHIATLNDMQTDLDRLTKPRHDTTMTVQQVLDELNKISNKEKPVSITVNTGEDFDGTPFIETGAIHEINEDAEQVEIADDLTGLYE